MKKRKIYRNQERKPIQKRKILLLGHTGKMGTSLYSVLKEDYDVIGKNSKDFDATDFDQVCSLIEKYSPDIVINTIAFLGIDPSESHPDLAFRLNTLYPKYLAELSVEKQFILLHFSTDAVFNDEGEKLRTESTPAAPMNMYGFTKFGGDCFIQTLAKQYYLFRVSILFGETPKNTQFVEKMLDKMSKGETVLRIADDIILSPTYTLDCARLIKQMLAQNKPYGLYHLSNKGKASLYELMVEIVQNLNLDVTVEKSSYKDFPFIGRKNTYTPIKSEKIDSMRPWREAVKDYCTHSTTLKNMTIGGRDFGR